MHRTDRVLVVGTTADYVDRLRNARPDQVIFLTEPGIRRSASEPTPAESEEILWNPEDVAGSRSAIQAHTLKWGIRLGGIACFDCEAMATAAQLAADLDLPYPSLEAVRISRDKYVSKQIWHRNGIACPMTRPVRDKADVSHFLSQHPNGVVLKPFCGSGSELVFLCRTPKACEEAVDIITAGLAARSHDAMFASAFAGEHRMLAEAWVEGPEFSCDFFVEDGRATILRTTRKIKLEESPFGTASAYLLCRQPDGGMDGMADFLLQAATAIGIGRGICMVDFIVQGDRPVLIEMTPRPGGDCLPYLLEAAGGLDTLGLAIDVAANRRVDLTVSQSYTPLIGLRIHAHRSGILKGFDTEALESDARVKQLMLIRQSGHKITMPPDDYDSWFLGHVLFMPDGKTSPARQCEQLARRIQVKIQ